MCLVVLLTCILLSTRLSSKQVTIDIASSNLVGSMNTNIWAPAQIKMVMESTELVWHMVVSVS